MMKREIPKRIPKFGPYARRDRKKKNAMWIRAYAPAHTETDSRGACAATAALVPRVFVARRKKKEEGTMSNVKTPLALFREREQKVYRALGKAKRQLLASQAACPHPPDAQVEAPYKASPHDHMHSAPFAVCTHCGYSETGWGAGYWRLCRAPDGMRFDPRPVSREEGLRFAVPRVNTQEDQDAERFGQQCAT